MGAPMTWRSWPRLRTTDTLKNTSQGTSAPGMRDRTSFV